MLDVKPAVLADVEAVRVLENVLAVGSGSLAANSSHSTCLRYCTCRQADARYTVLSAQRLAKPLSCIPLIALIISL